MIDKFLGADPVIGIGVDTPGSDVALQGEKFDAYKNREAHFFGIFCGKVLQSHAVMIGDADSVQSLELGNIDNLLQIDEAVSGIGTFVQMHIYQHSDVLLKIEHVLSIITDKTDFVNMAFCNNTPFIYCAYLFIGKTKVIRRSMKPCLDYPRK
jgi:hypothetical protein